jgi:hypothetical protein
LHLAEPVAHCALDHGRGQLDFSSSLKAKKDDGTTINLVAACASDIMLSSVQFSLKEVDANSVIRLFPGMEGMEIKYARCPAQ